MKKFYIISTDRHEQAGNHSRDFHRHCEQQMEYQFIDSDEDISTILSAIASRDHVHLEIGTGRNREWELLKIMIKANYSNIAIILLDTGFFKELAIAEKVAILKPFAYIYYRMIGRRRLVNRYLKKIKCIYVMTSTLQEQLRSRFKLNNTRFCPLENFAAIE